MIGIIGAGPAGLYAAYSCNNKNLPYIVFSCDSKVGGQCIAYYLNKTINNLPGILNISADKFINNLYNKCKFNKSNLLLNTYVSVKKEDEFVILSNDKEYKFKYVILATGMGRLQPIIPPNIHNFHELKSKNFIQTYCTEIDLYSNKIICIAGGGDSAVDYALRISQVAKKVILIHRRNALSCQFEKVQLLVERGNIEIKLNYQILSLELNKIFTDKEPQIYADYIIFCYGFSPDNNYLNQLQLEMQNNKILVDLQSMETSIKHCYAIGDVVIYPKKRRNILSCCWEAEQAVESICQSLEMGKYGQIP